MARYGVISLIISLCTVPTLAQDKSAVIEALPVESQSVVVTQSRWIPSETIDVVGGRIDKELGIFRAAYNLNPDIAPDATPELTARKWFKVDGPDFGIHSPETLELVHDTETVGARHLTFQQTLSGVKIYGSYIHVNFDMTGLPVMATSTYNPHLEKVDAFNPVPIISAPQSEVIAQLAVSNDGATSASPELFVLAEHPPRLAWRVIAWPDSTPAEWEVLLDANTGELIQLRDQRIFLREDPPSKVDGQGWVWLFDPLTASGRPYGGALVDNNDRDNATLSGLLIDVTLRDIKLDQNNRYRLDGPRVRIIGNNRPAEQDPNAFNYTRSDPRFEAVMIYYYITESHYYVQNLNTGGPNPSRTLVADPHATPMDNSWFSPARYSLGFGDGGVDDGEDVGVILHEFGHVLMRDRIPFGWSSAEQKVLAEGFADYWAVSYRRYLMDSGQVPKGDWRVVFPWDGVAWGGRRADGTYSYSRIKRSCRVECNFYLYSPTWSALMMNLWGRIGRENADQLHLSAFSYLGFGFTLLDMTQALLSADKALNNGRFETDIIQTFEPTGFIESVIGLPQISHTPPTPRIESALSSLKLQTTVTAEGLPILRAAANYRLNSGDFQRVPFIRRRGNIWDVEIPLTESTTKVEYYIEASTSAYTQTLPDQAPTNLFTVYIGRDTQSPTITYTPITHLLPQESSQMIEIQVTDNEAVSKVELEYTLTYSSGQSVKRGILPLQQSSGDIYTFTLSQIDLSEALLPGAKLEYRIGAFDAATPPNQANFPPDLSPPLRLDVLSGLNELGIWSPDQKDVLIQGEWMKDQNVFGHDGALWSTSPNKSYSDQPSISILTFSDVNLVGYPDAQLEFWHWYDFENTGVTGPGDSTGIIYDGGQIQISSDAGQSWSIGFPQWGYNGSVDISQSNPLGGSPVFGGSSFGWRRVRVPLPDAPAEAYRFDVNARLVFGTGAGNSNQTTNNFAGWAVRDIQILIDPPVDDQAPEIQFAPYLNQFVTPNQTSLPIRVNATDNIGIESVKLDLFSIAENQITRLQTFRLQPSETRSSWFEVDIPELMTTNSTLGYSIAVRDFDNNIQMIGDSQENLYRLHVPSEAPQFALSGVRSSGVWERMEETFSAQTDLHTGQSSLVLSPAYFSDSSDRTMLRLHHAFKLGSDSYGRVSVLENGGMTWDPLISDQDPLIVGTEAVTTFTGDMRQPIDSWFDLSKLKQPYQLRFDLLHSTTKVDGDYWEIYNAEYYRLSTNPQPISAVNDLTLYPNFPNPFINETAISYVIPETMNVRISLYNTLGQSVQIITDRMYEAGGYTLNIDLGGFAQGVYWIQMEAGNSLLQQPITLVR